MGLNLLSLQCFSENGLTIKLNAPSNPLSTTFPARPPRPKCTSHTLLVNIKRRDSKRSNAQSLRDSSINLWSVTIDKTVRNKWLSEFSDNVLRRFIFSPDKTHFLSYSRLSS